MGKTCPCDYWRPRASTGIFKATVVVVNGDDNEDSKGIGNANLKPSELELTRGRHWR